MKTLKEIYAEANRYAPDNEALREAFVQGARFMETGRCYNEKPMFPKEDEVETVDLQVTKANVSSIPTFETWWDFYGKKRGRKKAEAKWNKLSLAEKVACMRATPAYVASTPDPVYRKDPLTYLNGECWNDEIIQKQNHEQQRVISLTEKAARILGSDYQG